jgi:hypothetical protein
MRLISSRVHGVLDYVVGVLLILAPKLLGFEDSGPASQIPTTLGVLTILYSLVTRYELSLLKLLPFRAHLAIDAASGLLLAASPWLFGFADQIWVPHLVLGLLEIGAVMMTRRDVALDHPESPGTPHSRPV